MRSSSYAEGDLLETQMAAAVFADAALGAVSKHLQAFWGLVGQWVLFHKDQLLSLKLSKNSFYGQCTPPDDRTKEGAACAYPASRKQNPAAVVDKTGIF